MQRCQKQKTQIKKNKAKTKKKQTNKKTKRMMQGQFGAIWKPDSGCIVPNS